MLFFDAVPSQRDICLRLGMVHGEGNVICIPIKSHPFGKGGFLAGTNFKGAGTILHFHGRNPPALGSLNGNILVAQLVFMEEITFCGRGKPGRKVFPAYFKFAQRAAVWLYGNFGL